MEDLKRILVEHPFFKDLHQEYLELIVGCASNVRFDAGQKLFTEGTEANEFYLIRVGKVAIELKVPGQREIIIQTLQEGDIIGWSWLMPPYVWHFDARAVELTRAIALDGKCLRTKCELDKNLGYELLKRFSSVMVQQFEATRLQLLDVYGNRS
ncbi:MAG: cyclic nucleotide-binding domain-containing protein [Bacteroidetes bacterium]|nr:cyclic nucleotide-binding domain-containing protein [Bacteroidota bacterium]